MLLRITPKNGISKNRLLKALRRHGYKISYQRSISIDKHDRYTLRLARVRLLTVEKAQQRRKERGSKLNYNYAAHIRALSQAQFLAHLSARQLERGCFQARGIILGNYRASGQDCVDEILRRVGPAGEQARADEARYFDSFDQEQYSSNAHKGRDWREVSFVSVACNFSRAIICYANVGSFLHVGSDGGLHHLSFETYLIVRDSTSGDRHVLRIPPRFGRYTSATVSRYAPRWWIKDRQAASQWTRTTLCRDGDGYYRLDDLDSDNLTRAAVAWTFDLDPRDYRPQLTA